MNRDYELELTICGNFTRNCIFVFWIMLFIEQFWSFSLSSWTHFSCTAGMLSQMLACAVVRVVVSASCYQHLLPSTPVLNAKSIDRRSTMVSQLLCHLPREFSLKNHEIPFRFALNRVYLTIPPTKCFTYLSNFSTLYCYHSSFTFWVMLSFTIVLST